jgi:hypothetical protein
LPILRFPIRGLSPDAPDGAATVKLSSGLVSGFGAGPMTMRSLIDITQENFAQVASFGNLLFIGTSGQKYVYLHGNTGLIYRVDPDLAFPAMASVGTASANTQNARPFVQWGDDVIFMNGTQDPLYFPSGGGVFSNLVTGTFKPQCYYGGISYNHFIMAAHSGARDTVYWSAIDNPRNFDASLTTGAGSQRLVDIPGPITGLVTGETSLVFKERGISLMTYEGPPFTFGFRTLSGTYGCSDGNMIIEKGRNVYFYGRDGFKVIADRTSIHDIGAGKVEKFFRDANGANALSRAAGSNGRAFYCANSGLIGWMYVTEDAEGVGANAFIMYDDSSDEWYFHRDDSLHAVGICNGPWSYNSTAEPLAGNILVRNVDLPEIDTHILLSAYAYAGTQALSVNTHTLRLSEDSSVFVRAARVVARASDLTTTALSGTEMTCRVSNDPNFLGTMQTTTATEAQTNGWHTMLLDGQFAQFDFEMPEDMAGYHSHEMMFLELDVEGGGMTNA